MRASFLIGEVVILQNHCFSGFVGVISSIPSSSLPIYGVTIYNENVDSEFLTFTVPSMEENLLKTSFSVFQKASADEDLAEMMQALDICDSSQTRVSAALREDEREYISTIMVRFYSFCDEDNIELFMKTKENLIVLRAIGAYIFTRYSYKGFICACEASVGYLDKRILSLCWS